MDGVPTRQLFINGQWVAPVKGGRFPVVSPITEKQVGSIPAATPGDVELAVAAAVDCVNRKQWTKSTGAYRAKFLRAIADKVGCQAGAGGQRAWAAAALERPHSLAQTSTIVYLLLPLHTNHTWSISSRRRRSCWRGWRRSMLGSPSPRPNGTWTTWRAASSTMLTWLSSWTSGRWVLVGTCTWVARAGGAVLCCDLAQAVCCCGPQAE